MLDGEKLLNDHVTGNLGGKNGEAQETFWPNAVTGVFSQYLICDTSVPVKAFEINIVLTSVSSTLCDTRLVELEHEHPLPAQEFPLLSSPAKFARFKHMSEPRASR